MPSQPSKKVLTDAHFHLFAAGEGRPGARYVPDYDADFEAWAGVAGAAGVDRGVLVQPSFLGTDNTRLCAELRRRPGTLRGIAVIDAGWAADSLPELDACGVRGIRLNLAGVSHDLGEWTRAAPLWDALLRLGWHLELHTDPGALPAVLPRLPAHLPLVIDHMGKPDAASAADPTIAALRARTRGAPVHVKLSGGYRLSGRDAGAVARVLLGELGEQRLLWGSDWPCTNFEQHADYARLLAALHEWVGEGAALAALGENPAALYWGPQCPSPQHASAG